MENNRSIGFKYEQIAGKFLEANGINILEYNFSSRKSEIDIIGKDKETLVFFEVKYRTNNAYGEPYASVGVAKQRKIREGALLYLSKNRLSDIPCRFDVISICGKKIDWIKDAF